MKNKENKRKNKRYRRRKNTLTVVSVLFVLLVMAASVVIISAILFILGEFDVFGSNNISVIRLSLIALIASVVLGTGISALVSRFLLKPLNDVIDVMSVVASGDFSVRAQETGSKNPLHKLVRSFNMMVDELSGIELFRRDFINTFSHEFKTPIVSVRGFARQLRNAELSDAEKQECVDIIIAESERLSSMSSNILLLTKFESQSIVSGRSEFSLDEQLRRCLLLFEKQWSDKRLELDLELEEITVFANEEMLSHIWMNLLSNAIKFTPEGGRIEVVLTKETDGAVSVFVRDSGIGMSEEVKARIFEKFYQADPSRSLAGNGLGLALVNRIVCLCGGEIEVKSAQGKGSEFKVILPKNMP
ncbi:MAG: HAMP domain-containing histidine kinase [Clostridia bacterium]|nr:HAMP domain-containing histidine kinase [Clostridia bacterium]